MVNPVIDWSSPEWNSKRLLFYKRQDIQNAILDAAQDKEIAVKFGDKGFGKRPDILKFPGDIMAFVLKGATSFHASEELWYNPLQISPFLKPKEINEIRMGWDLVIDIDISLKPEYNHELDYPKIAAQLIINELRNHGIKSITCKFSGNHGFHIGVPFEAFPEVINGDDARLGFPKWPKIIAQYLKERIADKLAEKIMEYEDGDLKKIMEKTGLDQEALLIIKYEKASNPSEPDIEISRKLNVDSFLEIDTILISSRHLYRMPYSFNEKSGLISVPLDCDDIALFERNMARPEVVKVDDILFLDRKKATPNEAFNLFQQAEYYISSIGADKIINEEAKETYKVSTKVMENREFEEIAQKIPEGLFPPCIMNIKSGMEDGRKRALFAVTNFLNSCGWNYDDISDWLKEWNKNNEENCGEALRENLIVGQVRYHKQQKKKVLPPNCDNKNYYKSIGTKHRCVCQPDSLCSRVKNPVQYASKKAYFARQDEIMNSKKSKKKKQNPKKTKNDTVKEQKIENNVER